MANKFFLSLGPSLFRDSLNGGRTECFMGESKIVNLKSKKKKHACGIVQMLKLYKHEGNQRVVHYLVHKEAFI